MVTHLDIGAMASTERMSSSEVRKAVAPFMATPYLALARELYILLGSRPRDTVTTKRHNEGRRLSSSIVIPGVSGSPPISPGRGLPLSIDSEAPVSSDPRVARLVQLADLKNVGSSPNPKLNDRTGAAIVALGYFAVAVADHDADRSSPNKRTLYGAEKFVAEVRDGLEATVKRLNAVRASAALNLRHLTDAVLTLHASLANPTITMVLCGPLLSKDPDAAATNPVTLGAIDAIGRIPDTVPFPPGGQEPIKALLLAAGSQAVAKSAPSGRKGLVAQCLRAFCRPPLGDTTAGSLDAIRAIATIVVPRLSLVQVGKGVCVTDRRPTATTCAAIRFLSRARNALAQAGDSPSITPPEGVTPRKDARDDGTFSDPDEVGSPFPQPSLGASSQQLTWSQADGIVDDLWKVIVDPADALPESRTMLYDGPLLDLLQALIDYEVGCVFNPTEGGATSINPEVASVALQRLSMVLLRPESISFGSLQHDTLASIRNSICTAILKTITWGDSIVESVAASPSYPSSAGSNTRVCEQQALDVVHAFLQFLQRGSTRVPASTIDRMVANVSCCLRSLCYGASGPSVLSVAAQELMDAFVDPGIVGSPGGSIAVTEVLVELVLQTRPDAGTCSSISMMPSVVSSPLLPTSQFANSSEGEVGPDPKLAARVSQMVVEQYEAAVKTMLDSAKDSHSGDDAARRASMALPSAGKGGLGQWRRVLERSAKLAQQFTATLAARGSSPLLTSSRPQPTPFDDIPATSNASASMADGKDVPLATMHLTQLMRLCARLAWPPSGVVYAHVSEPRAAHSTAVASVVQVLPAIASLFECVDTQKVGKVKQFRVFWMVCSWHNLIPSGRSGEGDAPRAISNSQLSNHPVAKELLRIASHAPPLLTFRSAEYTRAAADATAIERHLRGNTALLQEKGKALQAAVAAHFGPEHAAVANRLAFSDAFLFKALSDLERMRAATGHIAPAAHYADFEVKDFEARPEVRTLAVAVVKCVTIPGLQRFVAEHHAGAREAALNTTIRQVIMESALASAGTRESAAEMVSEMVRLVPNIVAQRHAVILLLSLVKLIQRADDTEIESFCTKNNYHRPVALPYVASTGYNEQKTMLKSFSAMVEQWLEQCRDRAPHSVFASLLSYVVSQHSREQGATGTEHDMGGWIAMKVAMVENGNLPQRRGVAALAPSRLRNFSTLLLTRSGSLGELRSALVSRSSATLAADVLAELQAAVRASLNTAATLPVLTEKRLRKASTGDDLAATPTMAFDTAEAVAATRRAAVAMQNAAAWLAVARDPSSMTGSPADHHLAPSPRTLLRWLVLGPFHLFSPIAMQTAVENWKWVLHERPDLADVLVALIVDGWSWTTSQKIGLFDGHVPSPLNDIETGETKDAAEGINLYAEDYASNSPHKIIVQFVAGNLVDPAVGYAFDPAMIRYLLRLVAVTVATPSQLSLKDSSFSEYIRTALLLLSIIRNGHRAGSEVTNVPPSVFGSLRQGLYRVLLRWFAKAPSWYHTGNKHAAEQDINVLRELLDVLQQEQKQLSRSPSGFFDGDTPGDDGSAASEEGAGSVRLSVHSKRTKTTREGNGDGSLRSHREIISAEHKRLHNLLGLLRFLLKNEADRLVVWSEPSKTVEAPEAVPASLWQAYIDAATQEDPVVTISMTLRFPQPTLLQIVRQAVAESPATFAHIPEAVDFYVQEKTILEGTPALHLWCNCTITQSLKFLSEHFTAYSQVVQYAIRSLLAFDGRHLVFYLPQILQCLAHDSTGAIEDFLLRSAERNVIFAHQLMWSLQTETSDDVPLVMGGSGATHARGSSNDLTAAAGGSGSAEHARVDSGSPGIEQTALVQKCSTLSERVKTAFYNAGSIEFYNSEFDFIQEVISLSGVLKPVEKAKRKERVRTLLTDPKFKVPDNALLYVPTNPGDQIVEVIPHTANAMQSAAKCPILVQFKCKAMPEDAIEAAIRNDDDDEHPGGPRSRRGSVTATKAPPTTHIKACIFKMGDDCRQDQLALQIISMLQRVFETVQVPFFLSPYKVITTGRSSGIIECVPNSMSRDQIGKLVEGGLGEFFVQQYGHPHTIRFKKARDCFVRSMAAYSVASYLLNIKDRHNGNLLVDADGHLIHIDFGFIFDFSPGGDMNFESSPFKLTSEMLQLMGGDIGSKDAMGAAMLNAEVYGSFVDNTVRCFLAARQIAEQLKVLVELMLDSGLPCFKPVQTIANVQQRLQQGKPEAEAAAFMRARIRESEDNLRTKLYDLYQNKREGIEM